MRYGDERDIVPQDCCETYCHGTCPFCGYRLGVSGYGSLAANVRAWPGLVRQHWATCREKPR
jgi:hypothetical protein